MAVWEFHLGFYKGFCMRGWFGVEDVGTDCCCLWWFLDVMGARIVSGFFWVALGIWVGLGFAFGNVRLRSPC